MGTPDLILHRPRGIRAATFKTYHGSKPLRIVATVDLYRARERFDHPEVRIAAVGTSGSALATVTLKFQRHEWRSSEDGQRRARGFLAAGGGPDAWRSHAYGAHFEVRAEERAFLRRVLDLLDRGEKALRAWRQDRRRAHVDCDLLAMLLGLRLCGVEVAIRNPDLRVRRARHRADRTGTVVTAARIVHGAEAREYEVQDGPDAGKRYAATDAPDAWNVGQRCIVACNPATVTATRLDWVR